MKTTKNFVGMILFLIFLPAGFAAMADNTTMLIGHVVAVRGDVIAKDANGESRKLSIKSPIYREDTIETGKRGRVQVMFTDNTIISLGQESIIKIADYEWNPDQKTGAMRTQVKEGVFRVMGGVITKVAPKKFVTETPAASIGIRGSMYAGKVSEDGSLTVVFLGGTGIDVTNEAGVVALLEPGYGTTVSSLTEAPATPSLFTSGQMSEIYDGGTVTDPQKSSSTPDDNIAVTSTDAIADTINNSITDNNQKSLDQKVEESEPTEIGLAGHYLSVTSDSDGSGNNYTLLYGETSAISSAPYNEDMGTVTGEASTQNGTIPFSFSIPAYNPDAGYTGATKDSGLTRVVSLVGDDREFQTLEVLYSNPGEFAVFTITDGVFNDISTYNFNELGFAGVEAQAVPGSGVDTYVGPYLTASQGAIGNDLYTASTMEMVVNWGNGKVMGIMGTPGTSPTYFFGDVSGTSLANIRIVGTKILDETGTSAISEDGTGTFGQFYGTACQGVGLTAGTDIYSMDSDMSTPLDERLTAAGAFRDTASQHFSNTALTGTTSWEGFVVGVSENMADPNVNRKIFMNSAASYFQLAINRDTGEVSGAMSAIDAFAEPSEVFEITNLEIGGAYGSAYILDDAMIAVLGGTTAVRVTQKTAPFEEQVGGLKPYGNYMVTADPDKQFADYAKWGYWETAYVDPASGAQYHTRQPGSVWIAGERTPETYVDNMIAGNITGTYTGGAQGIHVNTTGVAELTGGMTDLTLNFGTSAVTGNIHFDQVRFDINGGSITNAGFSTQISNVNITSPAGNEAPVSSMVNGAFYGPNANSIGGNFNAEISSGDKYIGIFGGNRNL